MQVVLLVNSELSVARALPLSAMENITSALVGITAVEVIVSEDAVNDAALVHAHDAGSSRRRFGSAIPIVEIEVSAGVA